MWLLLQSGKRFRAGPDALNLDIAMLQERADAQLVGGIIFNYQKAPAASCCKFLHLTKSGPYLFGFRGLADEAISSGGQSVLPVSVYRDNLDRNMPRCGILFNLVEDRPAERVRQEDIETNGSWAVLAHQVQRFYSAHRNQHLVSASVCHVDQHPAVGGVVINNQQRVITGL